MTGYAPCLRSEMSATSQASETFCVLWRVACSLPLASLEREATYSL